MTPTGEAVLAALRPVIEELLKTADGKGLLAAALEQVRLLALTDDPDVERARERLEAFAAELRAQAGIHDG